MKKIVNIFGDITDTPYFEGDMSSIALSKEIDGEYDEIIVNINSFGGSVAEGLAIYNMLKQHKAKVITRCQGFACSIASIIFLAGDERIICDNSLLMIHNAWTITQGNANDLRKEADVLDKISQQSVDIYCKATGLDEITIKQMMDDETWIDSKEALELGFATSIQAEKLEAVAQSVKQSLIKMLKQQQEEENEEEENVEVEEEENVDEEQEEKKKEEEVADTDEEPLDVEVEDDEEEDDKERVLNKFLQLFN